MRTHEGHNRLVRPSVVLAAALSCGVACAGALGALAAPVVIAAVVFAAAIGVVSAHEQEFRMPFSSTAPAPPTSVVVIDAPRARQSNVA